MTKKFMDQFDAVETDLIGVFNSPDLIPHESPIDSIEEAQEDESFTGKAYISVFGHLKTGGRQDLFDISLQDREDAEAFAEEIEEILTSYFEMKAKGTEVRTYAYVCANPECLDAKEWHSTEEEREICHCCSCGVKHFGSLEEARDHDRLCRDMERADVENDYTHNGL